MTSRTERTNVEQGMMIIFFYYLQNIARSFWGRRKGPLVSITLNINKIRYVKLLRRHPIERV